LTYSSGNIFAKPGLVLISGFNELAQPGSRSSFKFINSRQFKGNEEMEYQEIIPCEGLRSYVKCFYIYESETDVSVVDYAFATGCIEVMFNLGSGRWQTEVNGQFINTPSIELWGQIIQPLCFKSIGKNIMFGVRFFPHAAAVFLNEKIEVFNNKITDFEAVAGSEVKSLHSKLLEANTLKKRVDISERFLLQRLSVSEKRLSKISLISNILCELKQDDFFDNIDNVAARHGISSRYLQKLFLQYTGLTPKLFSKINRFQNSLLLVAKQEESLTSIAYECGYFDQSHFIREFKSFTGFAPSFFTPENSSAVLASANK
jgi:AraC-like DNA-binding protein